MKRFFPHFFYLCILWSGHSLFAQDSIEEDQELSYYEKLFQKIEFGVEAELRGELLENFDFQDSTQSYLLHRLRLNTQLELRPGFHLFAEIQDAQVHGENPTGFPLVDGSLDSNAFENLLDLRQLYLEISSGKWTTRLGRQDVDIGYDRLFATNNWRNTSKTFDGGLLLFELDQDRTFQAFHFAVTPVDPNGFDDFADSGHRYYDSTYSGFIGDDSRLIDQASLKYFWILRNNPDFNDEVHTFGGSYIQRFDGFEAALEGAVQAGEFSGLDHRAWMLHTWIGKDIAEIGRVQLAYNYASGDDDPSDNQHGTFDHLNPRNHKFYGNMDLNSLRNHHSVDLAVRRKVFRSTDLTLGFFSFWLDEPETDSWYNGGRSPNRPIPADGVDSFLGNEIDVQLRYRFTKLFWLDAGVSRFFAGDFVKQTGVSDADPVFLFAEASYVF